MLLLCLWFVAKKYLRPHYYLTKKTFEKQTPGCTCTNGNPGGDYKKGCDRGVRGPDAQSCLWWSQGKQAWISSPKGGDGYLDVEAAK